MLPPLEKPTIRSQLECYDVPELKSLRRRSPLRLEIAQQSFQAELADFDINNYPSVSVRQSAEEQTFLKRLRLENTFDGSPKNRKQLRLKFDKFKSLDFRSAAPSNLQSNIDAFLQRMGDFAAEVRVKKTSGNQVKSLVLE